MILLTQKENFLYTYDPDSYEFFSAPISSDNVVNLSDFTPVDLSQVDNPQEVLDIRNHLISLVSNETH